MIRVCLLLAIAGVHENAPVRETGWARLKRGMRRGLDRMRWRLAPSRGTDPYAWTDRQHSNKGDHAIRRAVRAQLAAAFPQRRVVFSEIGWGDLTPVAAKAIGTDNDMFVIAGSGYYHLDANGDLAARVAADAEAMAHMTCRRVAYGIGINRNMDAGTDLALSPRTATVMARSLGMLDLVAVRDAQTASVLRQLGDAPVHLIGDPVFGADAIAARPPPRPGARMRVGLNLAFHRGGLGTRLAHNLPVYAATLRRFAGAHDAEFHYVIHSDAERAMPLMLASHGLRCTVHDLAADDLPALYASLDLHVCEMLHSSIMAVSAGTPTLNIGYDLKNRAFFDLLGIGKLSLTEPKLTEAALWDGLQTLLAQRDGFAASVAAHAQPLMAARDAVRDDLRRTVPRRVLA